MTEYNGPPRRVSMAYILGFSNKPFKDPKLPPPLHPPQPSGLDQLMSTPGGIVEWAASDGRKGKLTGPGKARSNEDKSKKASSEKGAKNVEREENKDNKNENTNDKDKQADKKWTAEEDKKLLDWKNENRSAAWTVCSEAIGRSVYECKERFNQIKPKDWNEKSGKEHGNGGGSGGAGDQQQRQTKKEKKQNKKQNPAQPQSQDQNQNGKGNRKDEVSNGNANNNNTTSDSGDLWGAAGGLDVFGDTNNENKNDNSGAAAEDWPGVGTSDSKGGVGGWDDVTGATAGGNNDSWDDNNNSNGGGGGWDQTGIASGGNVNVNGNPWEDNNGGGSKGSGGSKKGASSKKVGSSNKGGGSNKDYGGWSAVVGNVSGGNNQSWTENNGGGSNKEATGGAWGALPSGDKGGDALKNDGGKASWDKTGGDGANDAGRAVNDNQNNTNTLNNSNGNDQTAWDGGNTPWDTVAPVTKSPSKEPTNRPASHNSSHRHFDITAPRQLEVKPDDTFSADDLRLIARILQQDYQMVWNRVSWRFRDKTGRNIAPEVFEKKITGRVEGEASKKGERRK